MKFVLIISLLGVGSILCQQFDYDECSPVGEGDEPIPLSGEPCKAWLVNCTGGCIRSVYINMRCLNDGEDEL